MVPWLKTFPKKVAARVEVWAYPITALAFTYATIVWTDHVDHEDSVQHRF